MDHLLVTTTVATSPQLLRSAASLARDLGSPFIPRGTASVRKLLSQQGYQAAVVCGARSIRIDSSGQRYEWHPNMAKPRIGNIRSGGVDSYIKVAGIAAGDRVLDCTCGMGADAIVASYAVGAEGKVLALESSRLLSSIVTYGMRVYGHRDVDMIKAMRRVVVTHADCALYLQAQPADSWDIVYLDPMFEDTIGKARGIDLLRAFASMDSPKPAAIDEAHRVARRKVVIKDRVPGRLLKALGVPVVLTTKRICYGEVSASK